MRDLSIIATPPARRLSIKTFVWSPRRHVIKEAISRELLRGGQVFYLHNESKPSKTRRTSSAPDSRGTRRGRARPDAKANWSR
jgi:transcription-repair coupling factor (superfamily II helicase)